ncbi:MAG: D-alanyl-D-alanine carboxypeptidase [Desulforegulaceae bacterium]|nr:D-alanyl-D-alanine carboxypeptidase [Desulforegulaceae bacterium]
MIKKILTILIILCFPANLYCAQRSIVLFDPEKNKALYFENIEKELIPASTIKVLTALISIEKLGLDYRFSTKAYIDEKNNLYIKGFGDPLFISEQIKKFSKKISKKSHSKEFNDLIIDQSFFSQLSINFKGTKTFSKNTYDSPNNALAANFNSVCFKKKDNIFISCEKETPLLKEVLFLIEKTGLNKGRIPLSAINNANLLYPAQLIKYFLENEGISFNGKIRLINSKDKNDLKEIVDFKSDFTLKDIIEKMLFYSNNFIANQLFMCIGADKNGADIEKSVNYYKNYLDQNQITANIIEGSGISRENKISAKNMVTILNQFKPYYLLMKKDGNGNFYKTGTLTGVKNICGYYLDNENKIFIYSIFLNESDKNPFNEFSFLKDKIKNDF